MPYKTEQLETYMQRHNILSAIRDIIRQINPAAGTDLHKALEKIEAEIEINKQEAFDYLVFPFRPESEPSQDEQL